MKKHSLTLVALFISASASAETLTVPIDWNDPSTLSNSITMVCDDVAFSEVEIVVPGQPGADFHLEATHDISNGPGETMRIGCRVRLRDSGPSSTTYVIDRVAEGCALEVRQAIPRRGPVKVKTAFFEFSDAC